MNRSLVSSILLLAVSGCRAPTPPGPLPPPPPPVNRGEHQIDIGSYTMKNGATTVMEMWADAASDGGVRTEFWAQVSPFNGATSLAIQYDPRQDASCAAWWKRVCNETSPAPTYSQTNVLQNTVFGCTPPDAGSGVPVLPVGNYELLNSSGALFAWVFVQGTTEYWAMDEMLGAGPGEVKSATLSAESAPYTTPQGFATYLCGLPAAQHPVLWFAPSYSAPVSMGSCTTPPSGCGS